MDLALELNRGHPQRRKMYQLNDRHNLSSSVQLAWLNSLKSPDQQKHSVIIEKQLIGSSQAKQRYNNYVQRQLQNRYKPLNYATIQHDQARQKIIQQNKSNNSQVSSNDKVRLPYYQQEAKQKLYQNKNERLDKSLNQQIQTFRVKTNISKGDFSTMQPKTTGIYNRQRKHSFDKNQIEQGYSMMNPRFFKQLILRSALDPPQIYINPEPQANFDIRNANPSHKQSYLRQDRNQFYR